MNSKRRETRLPRKAAAKMNALWSAFGKLKCPTPQQMDQFLEGCLALPPAATPWSDVFDEFVTRGYVHLLAVFRRIVDAVPHTAGIDLSYLYWGAAEAFADRGLERLLPEVAAGFRKLDLESYNNAALVHLQDLLLAANYDDEALQLAERFLPVLR